MGMFGQKDAGAGAHDDAAARYLAEAASLFKNLKTPSAADLRYELGRLVQTGELSPDQANAILVENSAYDGIQADPMAKEAQAEALQSLQEIGRGGGMNAVDRAKTEEMLSRINQEERGAREAIMMRANERGAAGSGTELIQQLVAQQEGATRAAQEGLDIEAQAQKRALEALQASGAMGSQMRGQQFDEQSRMAEAKDAIAKFNAANRQDVEMTNVATRNDARARNLGEKQRVADQNVEFGNEESRGRADSNQQEFENRLTKTQGYAGVLGQQADMEAAQAAAARERAAKRRGYAGNMVGGATQGLAQGYGSGLAQKGK